MHVRSSLVFYQPSVTPAAVAAAVAGNSIAPQALADDLGVTAVYLPTRVLCDTSGGEVLNWGTIVKPVYLLAVPTVDDTNVVSIVQDLLNLVHSMGLVSINN